MSESDSHGLSGASPDAWLSSYRRHKLPDEAAQSRLHARLHASLGFGAGMGAASAAQAATPSTGSAVVGATSPSVAASAATVPASAGGAAIATTATVAVAKWIVLSSLVVSASTGIWLVTKSPSSVPQTGVLEVPDIVDEKKALRPDVVPVPDLDSDKNVEAIQEPMNTTLVENPLDAQGLAREGQKLSEIDRILRRERWPQARRLIQSFEREFQSPQLVDELKYMKLVLACGSGAIGKNEAPWRNYIATHSGSDRSRRLQQLCVTRRNAR